MLLSDVYQKLKDREFSLCFKMSYDTEERKRKCYGIKKTKNSLTQEIMYEILSDNLRDSMFENNLKLYLEERDVTKILDEDNVIVIQTKSIEYILRY